MCSYCSISAHGDSKLPSSIKGDSRTGDGHVEADTNTTVDVREVPEDFGIPNSSLKVFKFADLENATGNFSPDFLLGRGQFGQMFLGWVDVKSFAPSSCGDGIAVLVKRRSSLSSRRYHQCLVCINICTAPSKNHETINKFRFRLKTSDFKCCFPYHGTGTRLWVASSQTSVNLLYDYEFVVL